MTTEITVNKVHPAYALIEGNLRITCNGCSRLAVGAAVRKSSVCVYVQSQLVC